MKKIKVFLIMFLSLIIIGVSLFYISKAREFQFFWEIISHIETDKKVIALTFDDGPTKEYTEKVLKILDENKLKATFYLVWKDLKNNPDETKKIVEAGHEIWNHSFSHSRMVLKSSAFVKREIENTNALIRKSWYKWDIHFRPPYWKKLFILPWYLKQNNIKTVTWDVEPETYLSSWISAEEIAKNVIFEAQPGSIILLHIMFKSREETRKSISLIVAGLRKKWYKFVTVSELLKYKK